MRWAGTPLIWVASSLLGAGLLLVPKRWRLACSLSCLALGTLVYAFDRMGWRAGLVFNLFCLTEAWLLAWFCNRFVPSRHLSTLAGMSRLMFCAIVPATAAGSLLTAATAELFLKPPRDFAHLLAVTTSAKFLGMGVVMPSLVLLLGPSTRQEQRRPWWEMALVYAGLAVLTIAPLMIWRFPAILLVFPAIVAVAFRYGSRTCVIAASILSGLTLVATAWTWHVSHDLGKNWIPLIQQFVGAVFFTGVVTAIVVDQQLRLRRMLMRRTSAAWAARRQALKASRAKTDFLATMSHEIRTPMNSMIGFAQLLQRREDLPAEAQEQVRMINQSGAALLTVVNDILDFSKVEAGEIELSPREVFLPDLAQEMVAIVGEPARQKGLAVRLQIEGEIGQRHLVDDQRLRQVMFNLLNNAVKFTERGTVTLKLSAEPAEAGDLVRIVVADTGVGIPADRMDRLFKRFSQVDGSVTRVYGGTGLGLAISKGLITRMGGAIGASSVEGQGSTFWLELPLARGGSQVEQPAAPRPADGDLAARILLVDDHPANRELGTAILEVLGCVVDVADDGRQAIEAVRVNRYDAILMDVHMPHMDGLEATRAILALGGAAAETPVIALSADVLPEQVDQCRRAGMVDSVGKPIRIEVLQAALERWIGRRPDGQARAA